MDITIKPGCLKGSVQAIPSKSVAHRALICAAFSDGPTTLICPETNDDIQATAQCLNALGADIRRIENGYQVKPAEAIPETAVLDCKESGSTLRFMLPVAGALGVDAEFVLSGRLPQRPMSPLWEEMERMGCSLSRPTANTIRCQGKLNHGAYQIDAGVSSQFITGLLFAMVLMKGASTLELLGKVESAPYIKMTKDALMLFGIDTSDNCVSEDHKLHSPGMLTVEGDWSNAAFFLAAESMGNDVSVTNLNFKSSQGDSAVVSALAQMDTFAEIDAANIPDLVPILAVAASAKHGAIFNNIERLRLKESDRVASVCAMINNLGGKAESTKSTLTVYPSEFTGGTVDSVQDHRIAMSAAIAATVAKGNVTILDAQCVKKSYPDFWNVYQRLGGKI